MADNLLDNYNPLYDIHLRQYFALPHMQKHLQKMGLLESTLNLNGDEVYARHHAMMDMMLKNREAQLIKMAELRKKLDAAEKVECCRRIRTGQSPESYRQGKPSRSLSRNRAGQKSNGSGGRQRRYSNSFEDRDFVQRIEERNADPLESNTRDPYKRLSANAKRFNYLHKLDDSTLVAYKDNLKKQLQRLERFREISFGPHSVARQPPPPQTSWFFRRRSLPSLTASAGGTALKEPLRSVLNMRGRKATTGNKLNASHDSRTSCPPTTRKRKDSNVRLPPIHPPSRQWVPTKPPVPVSIQQTTTKLPPAAKKPAPTRGRPSTKRQTTTTTITTVSSVSKSPPKEDITTTTLPTLPSVTGHGIFTGAAAAATAAAIGTVALNVEDLIASDSEQASPVSETRGTHGRNSPAYTETIPIDNSHELEESAEKDVEQGEEEHVVRQIEAINAANTHGDYEDSSSEPEYAEEDKETPVEIETVALGVTDAIVPEPFSSDLNSEGNHAEQERPAEPNHDEALNTESQSLNRCSPTLSDTNLSIEKPTVESTDERPNLPTEKTEEKSEQYREETPDRVLSVNSSHDSVAHHASEIVPVAVINDHKIEQSPKSPVEKYDHHGQVSSSPVRSLNSSPVLEDHGHSPPKAEDYSEHEFEKSEHSPLLTSQDAENSQFESPTLPNDAVYEQEGLVVQNPITVHEQSEPKSPESPVLSHHESHHLFEDLDTQDQPPVQLLLNVNSAESLEQTETLQSPAKTEIFEEHAPLDASESTVTKRETPELSDRSMSYQNVSPSLEQEVGFERATSVHSQASNDLERSPSVEAPAEEFLAEENISTTAEHLFVSEEKPSGMGSPTVDQVDESSSLIPSQEDMKNHPISEHNDVVQQELMSPVHDDEHHEIQEEEKQHDVLSADGCHQHQEETDLERSTIMGQTNEGAHQSSDHVDQVSHNENEIRQELAEHVSSDHIMFEEPENIVEPVEEERSSPALRTDPPDEVASSELLAQNSVVENLSDNVEHGLVHEISHGPVEINDVPIVAPLSRKISHASDNQDVVASSPENIAAETEFAPRYPSVHTSDAEDEHEEMKHGSNFNEKYAPKSPTEMDLYNPSRGDVDSPVMSDSSPRSETAPFTEGKNITAYQDSETRESTSPVPKATEDTNISIEQVAQHIDQHPSPKEDMAIVDTISNTDNDSSLPSQSIIEQTDSIGNVEKEEDEHVALQNLSSNNPNTDLMTTSVYQSGSYQENEMFDDDHLVHHTNQSDEKNDRFLESSDAMHDKTVQEQSDVKDSMILDEDNISTDSLSIHDKQPNPMMQSIYQPQSENEDNDGDHQTDHVQTTVTEKTDESGRHYKETVTSTTNTVIKSGDDLENNNDEEDQESGHKEQIIEEEEEHGANGNLVKETITTTTTTITSEGFPEGGILVDDGDESNISSI
ncbi:hypothetical protein L5515_016198 [Caenorhabditis briggsae]|uniref:Uncharacterized protein n=1 Tax=Caenorhabditis briggsae TaxID=6238 RepID=A0AAE9FBJ1_CAEBR|nr:hypothetical protein L5515_016198 [Caenorhabditis briggsae]